MKVSFSPLISAFGGAPKDITAVASDRWEIGPAGERYIPPAIFLPQLLDRIRGTKFGSLDDILRDFRGDFVSSQGPTVGYRLQNVDLVDGVLYAKRALRHLRQRTRKWPAYKVPAEVETGALYESWLGNRWFGNWLSDDCPRYLLAEQFGQPVTTRMHSQGHIGEYEQILGMAPGRIKRAHFKELFLFDDMTLNTEHQHRLDQQRARIIKGVSYDTHPGVYLLRGETGDRRVLSNERAIADCLSSKYGFQIVEPEAASAKEIIAACAGARIVAGVEGSQLVHGLVAMPPGATLLVVQPPTRVTSALKLVADSRELGYAFAVGTGNSDEFHLDLEDVERTLGLIDLS